LSKQATNYAFVRARADCCRLYFIIPAYCHLRYSRIYYCNEVILFFVSILSDCNPTFPEITVQ